MSRIPHELLADAATDGTATPSPQTMEAIAVAATERALRELLELTPGDAFAHCKYAQFLAGQYRSSEAEAQFHRALELQPEFIEALRGLASQLVARRDFPSGIALLRRAVAIRPDDVQSLADLGNSVEVVERMRFAPFGLQTVVQLAVVTLLPVAPLLLTVMPLNELLKALMKLLF